MTEKRERDYGQQLHEIKKEHSFPHYGVINKEKRFFEQTRERVTTGDIDETLEDIETMRVSLLDVGHKVSAAERAGDVGAEYARLVRKSIDYMQTELEMFSHAVFLEAEKNDYQLEDYERAYHHQQVLDYQTELYGPAIHELPEERTRVMSYFYYLFSHNQDNLTSDQQTDFAAFLDEQIERYGEEVISEQQDRDQEVGQSGWEVPRDDYVQILRKSLKLYGLDDREVVIGSYGNISASRLTKQVKIPESPQYAVRSVLDICGLIDHEITRHVNAGENTEKTMGIPIGNYLLLEEGLAMTVEELVGKSINQVGLVPTVHHLSTYIAEHYDYQQTEALIRCYFDLADISKYNPAARAARVKRYVSYQLPGGNRKDVVYWRGLRYVVNYLRTHSPDQVKEFIRKSYVSKLGIDEVGGVDVDALLEELQLNESDLQQPLWIGQLLYHRLLGAGLEENPLVKYEDATTLTDEQEQISHDIVEIFLASKPPNE